MEDQPTNTDPNAMEAQPQNAPSTNDEGQADYTPPEPKDTMKELEYDGYHFSIDTEKLDDVEVLEMLDAIQNKNQPTVMITFLQTFIGEDQYKHMKSYFVEKDGRFSISKLTAIYEAIFDNFDPKG